MSLAIKNVNCDLVQGSYVSYSKEWTITIMWSVSRQNFATLNSKKWERFDCKKENLPEND